MNHTIKEISEVIMVMNTKIKNLEYQLNNLTEAEIQYVMDDIRSHAGQIYNDRGRYKLE